MKNNKRVFLTLVCLWLVWALAAPAQSPIPSVMPPAPDVIPTQTAGSIVLIELMEWGKARISDMWAAKNHQAWAISVLWDNGKSDAKKIATLQMQVAALEARLKTLEGYLAVK